MATWTDVSSTVLEPGDPIRSVDIIAIKENIIALSEGADGAPKIQANALDTGTNERNWVLERTAGATAGAVGTYMLAGSNVWAPLRANTGDTRAASQLRPAGFAAGNAGTSLSGWGTGKQLGGLGQPCQGSVAMSGTWRCMGSATNIVSDDSHHPATLWLRIS
jgi:hypothetical protein